MVWQSLCYVQSEQEKQGKGDSSISSEVHSYHPLNLGQHLLHLGPNTWTSWEGILSTLEQDPISGMYSTDVAQGWALGWGNHMDDIVSALAELTHGQSSSHHKWESTDRVLAWEFPDPFRETQTDVLQVVKGATKTSWTLELIPISLLSSPCTGTCAFPISTTTRMYYNSCHRPFNCPLV